jgi:hypothetical protein
MCIALIFSGPSLQRYQVSEKKNEDGGSPLVSAAFIIVLGVR